MLQIIRDRAQSWIAWVIIILIIIPFALWGINQYFGGGKEVAAAHVNGVAISQPALQQALAQQQQRLRSMLGANYRPELFPEEQLKQQVLQRLIEQELLTQTASDSGMVVSDAALAATIRGVPAFQQDGQFSQDAYERALRVQGLVPATFEAELRRDMLTQQFYASVARTEFATSSERKALASLRGEQRDIGYLVLPVSSFQGQASVPDAEVQAFYDEQSRLFMQPEQVRVAYLELSVDGLAKGIKVSEDELRARYQAQLASYRTPEERHARHILIKVDKGADAAEVAAARAKAEDILKQLRAGASFADLAKKDSQDPGSASQGGDLGFFGRGMMDKAFEDAVFALKPGEVSEPVRSSFGFHIIRLEAVRGGKTETFADVRDQILTEIRNEQAEKQYYDLAEKLSNLTYEHPDTLEEASRQLGLPIQQSEPFSRQGGKGLWANPKLVNAAFSDDVLVRGNNSEAIDVDKSHLVVLRVIDHQPETRKPLASVRNEIIDRLRHEKAAAAARTAAQDMLAKLAKGGDPEKLAREAKVKWVRSNGLTREGSKLDAAILRAAFAMARPQGERPTWHQTSTGNGDQVVVGLYAVRAGEGADAANDGAQLERASGEAAFMAVMNGIRARSEVKITKNAP